MSTIPHTLLIGDILIRKMVKSEFVAMEEEDNFISLLKSTLKDNKPVLKKKLSYYNPPKRILDLDLCRICNDKKGISLICEELQEKIYFFSGIAVEKTDNLPQKICQKCLDLLNGCILFRDMCRKTNSILLDLLSKKEATSGGYGEIVYIHPVNHDDEDDDSAQVDIIDKDSFNPICIINTSAMYPEIAYEEDSCDQNEHEPQSEDQYIADPPQIEHVPDEPHSEDGYIKDPQKQHDTKIYVRKHETNPNKDYCKRPLEKKKKSKSVRKYPKKTLLCEVCGSTWRSPQEYEKHKSVHENKFPFKCDLCPYRGRTKCLLKVHKISHLPAEDKPFKCKLCPYTVSTASNLNRHVLSLHSTTKAFKCEYCNKAFQFRHYMTKHIRVVHLNMSKTLLKCDLCPKTYTDKHHLYRHRKLIHKIKSDKFGRQPNYLLAQAPKDQEEE